MYDPSGHIAISTLIFGALIGAAISLVTTYAMDVLAEMQDGFDWSDFNTFEGNLWKYGLAFIGGAISGFLGAYGSVGLSFVGDFVGNMVENAYTFTSAQNVGYAIWTSILAGGLAGIGTGVSNKLTKSYFDKGLANTTKNARKQINQYFKRLSKARPKDIVKLPTNDLALDLLNKTIKYNDRLNNITDGVNVILGLFY